MIIILEGPDGSGKTTLAAQLSKQFGYPIIHRHHPRSATEKQQMMDQYLDYINNNKNAIFDRCWYSEMVYGPVMQDIGTDDYIIAEAQMYELEERLAKNGAMIIYCGGLSETLWTRCVNRGESYVINKSQYLQIFKNYVNLFLVKKHLIPVLIYEYTE